MPRSQIVYEIMVQKEKDEIKAIKLEYFKREKIQQKVAQETIVLSPQHF